MDEVHITAWNEVYEPFAPETWSPNFARAIYRDVLWGDDRYTEWPPPMTFQWDRRPALTPFPITEDDL
jgi:hypothetical protein